MQRLADLLIFVGPSGGGKSTLIAHLLQTWPQQFSFCTSHTTRKPRKDEVDGKHYHFVSKDAFKHMIHRGEFVEYNKVFSSCGSKDKANASGCGGIRNGGMLLAEDDADYYGTSKRELHGILAANKVAVLDTDITGAINIKKYCVNIDNDGNSHLTAPLRVQVVLVKLPSLDVLKERLRLRGSESEASLRRRLCASEKWMKWCTAHPEFFHCHLVNLSLDVCKSELRSFVGKNVLQNACKL
ncbi:guanylate kinase [Trypanosoma rangeli]|uniref:Guanylate kinase n=1 Tax=Trypanosoma rangeli TaxID=5698 RepID=A0A3R7LXR6_TRYRA|nr:guanylate kinase [Trypanosoma rangeli]RNF05407.1 guanylate kinase [Trypanosoma rangeli]|eukprot:RNF05407.1 guanylate kinase [Trypanosoma rangeli]